MEIVEKLNRYKLGLELSSSKLSQADECGDIIFLRKFKKSSDYILELVDEAFFVLEEVGDGK